MNQLLGPIRNQLLLRLVAGDLALLGPLERVSLKLRQSLEVANATNDFVYFMEDGVASVVSEVSDTYATEIGIIGREGMTGLGFVYGDHETPFETFMQIEGSALRCRASELRKAMADSPPVRVLLLTYARAFSIQVGVTAVVNGRSKLEERLARWLLMVEDRMGASFSITHEFMSVMLAVRRSGVTLAVQSLEGKGLLRASRGAVHIVDRDGLIDAAARSYGLAEREYDRLLGAIPLQG